MSHAISIRAISRYFSEMCYLVKDRHFDSYTEHHNLNSQSKCTDNYSNLIEFICSK